MLALLSFGKVVSMNKENSLYGIIGLLLGLIIGYIGTNFINSSAPVSPANNAASASALPPDHPPTTDPGSGSADGAPQANVMGVIEQARKDPANFEAQMKAADMFQQINRKEGALEFYERAVKIKPNDYDLLVNLGNATFDLEHYEDAAQWYEQALKIKPDDVTVRMDLGLTYYYRSPRDLERAIEIFRAVLKADPRHEKTLQNLAQALVDKGDKSAAAETLKQLEKVNPSNQAIAQLRSRL